MKQSRRKIPAKDAASGVICAPGRVSRAPRPGVLASRWLSGAEAARGVVEEFDTNPAYVRECAAGWHVYDGGDNLCCSFSKGYDSCRLHAGMLILCKRFPGAVDVVEYRWDEVSRAFIEHRRYTDEAPFCDDLH